MSRAPSPATCSPSRSWSSRPRTGGGRRSSPASGCWPTSFPEPWLNLPGGSGGHNASNSLRGHARLRPFPGTMGWRPAETGQHSVIPPSEWGGNMDIKHLRAGTTLYLPVGRSRRPVLGRRYPCRHGRRRGVRDRRGDGHGHRRPPHRPPGHGAPGIRSTGSRPANWPPASSPAITYARGSDLI